MAKTFGVTLELKDATASGAVKQFVPDAGAYSQAMAHSDIHTFVTQGEGDAAVTKEVFIPWDAIGNAAAFSQDSTGTAPAPEDAVCNGGE